VLGDLAGGVADYLVQVGRQLAGTLLHVLRVRLLQ
jgi:hypothetical protein